jgi:hypothetical protein
MTHSIEPNQGEPVTLPERQTEDHFSEKLRDKAEGWNACLDEIAKLGPLYSRSVHGEPVAWLDPSAGLSWLVNRMTVVPGTKLYTHADPGEVEQFPHGSPANKAVFMALESYTGATTFEQACIQLAEESRALRAQLAEARALLRRAVQAAGDHYLGWDLFNDISDAISASAEPSTPVEIDERAAFEKALIDKAERFLPDLTQYGDLPDAEYRGANIEWAWGLWQARAALERKP